MSRETVSMRQAVCILMVFIFGSSLVVGLRTDADQDSMISLAMAAVGVLPVVLVYARIMKLFPEKGIFDIIEALLGKVFGKIVTALLVWYAIHLASLVMRNFSEFIQITALPETPQLPVMAILMLVTAYIAKSGVGTFGKWALAVFPFISLILIGTTLMTLNKIDLTNLQPVFEHDIGTIALGSFSIASFPFAETVLFLGIAGAVKRTDSPKKIYISAILISCALLLTMMFRNLGIMGNAMWKAEYFPSYTAARIIHISDYIMRVEGFLTMNFIFSGITKITVCLFAASKGIASLLGISDYRQTVLPVGLLTLALCAIVYKSTMEMFAFIKVYEYYAFPFEVVIPLIIWITAEIRTRRGRLFLKA